MDPKQSKLRQREKEELAATTRQQQGAARQFRTAEEVIRFDASQVEVPPVIAQRLNESLAREPRSSPSWWKRWMGRSSL